MGERILNYQMYNCPIFKKNVASKINWIEPSMMPFLKKLVVVMRNYSPYSSFHWYSYPDVPMKERVFKELLENSDTDLVIVNDSDDFSIAKEFSIKVFLEIHKYCLCFLC